MKILPVEKVREVDAYTIKHEPVDSNDLMERAARACFKWIFKLIKRGQVVKIFTGLGNNGGDGLAVGRLLAKHNVPVEVYVIRYSQKTSEDFKINYERLEIYPDIRVTNLEENDELPELGINDLVIDAIFGSGLSKPIKGFIARIIEHINNSGSTVIAVDIPSGLNSDKSSKNSGGAIIKANFTLSFQFTKYSFLFAENEEYVGSWEVLPIGLHQEYISSIDAKNYYIEKNDITQVIKKRKEFAHKGHYGHALLISGGYGKMGAAILASRACLRTGVGLLTTHIPKKGYEILQSTVPEAMVSIDSDEYYFTGHPDLISYNAIAIGPGIGMDDQTQNALKVLIQNTGLPIIFDADAINILAENRTWISFIPPHSIFTPHPKEFERITEKTTDDFERVELQRQFSIKYNVYVVLKGAYTSVSCPDGSCYFNSTGNPGMATAGSGDVLTGIILGLIAQNYSSKEAAILGVYLHGLAGNYAAGKLGFEAMLAGDIIDHLGKAYKEIHKEEAQIS